MKQKKIQITKPPIKLLLNKQTKIKFNSLKVNNYSNNS